jgi:hypothetical protein
MAKKSISDLSFEFGDDGELQLDGFSADDEFEDDDVLEDEEEVVEDEEEVVEEEEELSDDITSRIGNLEKTIQALPQMIATSIASALGNSKQQKEDDEDEDIPDELDNKQIVNILAKRMQKAVKTEVTGAIKSLKDSDPDLRDAKITAEFQRANAKYGQKFRDRMIPVAKIVQKSNYGISVEDAYLSIADMPVASSKGSVKTKTGKVPKSVKVDADSDDSVGDINQQNPRPKMNIKKIREMSDAEAFQASWNKSLMSHVRGSRNRR